MTKIKEYLSNPAVRISFIAFIFGLGGLRATTNNRLSALETKYSELDTVKIQMYEIQTTLGQIQTDILWIKQYLVK